MWRQDTGGFFIALLRKKASLPAGALAELPATPDLFGRKRCMDSRKEMEATAKAEAAAAAAAAKLAAAEAAELTELTREEEGDGGEVGVEAECAGEEGEEEAENLANARAMPLAEHVNGQASWQLIKSFYEVRGAGRGGEGEGTGNGERRRSELRRRLTAGGSLTPLRLALPSRGRCLGWQAVSRPHAQQGSIG